MKISWCESYRIKQRTTTLIFLYELAHSATLEKTKSFQLINLCNYMSSSLTQSLSRPASTYSFNSDPIPEISSYFHDTMVHHGRLYLFGAISSCINIIVKKKHPPWRPCFFWNSLLKNKILFFLDQGCPSRGPRAACGPALQWVWPNKSYTSL